MMIKPCGKSLTLISFAFFILLDLRSDATLQKDEPPHRCYKCDTGRKQPHCGYIASVTNVTSTPLCLEGEKNLCSLTFTTNKQTYEIICACNGHPCNLQNLREKLAVFVANNGTLKKVVHNFTDTFSSTRVSHNDTLQNVSSSLQSVAVKLTSSRPLLDTVSPRHSKSLSTAASVKDVDNSIRGELGSPRAEALKHETTPSDDDEDEGEGSGSIDEPHKRPGSAPAAPSSHLPAKENNAISPSYTVSAVSLLICLLCTILC